MTLTTLEQEILSHLHTLALPQQREVLAFVRTLAATPVGVPGKELLAFAGAIEPHERDYNQYHKKRSTTLFGHSNTVYATERIPQPSQQYVEYQPQCHGSE